MSEQDASQPNSEERLWSALAHFSSILFGWGLIAPVVIWVVQRGKSGYVRFQALQALEYQVSMAVVWLLVAFIMPFLIPVFLIGGMAITGAAGRNSEELFSLFLMLVIFGGYFSVFGLYLVIGLAGAVACLLGRNFHYPLLGSWLERYLAPAPGGSEEGA